MSIIKDFKVELCERIEIKEFIETWHYSKSINGVRDTYCFKLVYQDKIIGAMLYGALGMANCWKKYATTIDGVIELRRLCCIDDTPKNTESYFIGATLRWLRKNTDIQCVVSYADPNFNHTGIIYKASNFTFMGITSKGRVIERLSDGKVFHDKTIRTKYKGELKPFAQRLKDELNNGTAIYKTQEGKYIYLYNLNKKIKPIHDMEG
jgi:hypothetical protein